MTDIESDIEIIVPPTETAHFTATQILAVLAAERVELARETAFMGRPKTRVHVHDGHVVKLREELNFDLKSARRWVLQTTVRERTLAVHHPRKTWFIQRSGETLRIGNIAPELRQMNMILGPEADAGHCVDELAAITEMYARVAAAGDYRLDEGLSNFGRDRDDTLYYLDDDLYRWDDFNGHAQILGIYIRSLVQLDVPRAEELGQRVAQAWRRHHPDPQVPHIVARLVRDLPMASDAQNDRQAGLVRGLEGVPAKKKTTRPQRKAPSRKSDGAGKRIALLADVHANAPALAATLSALRAENVDSVIVLGDIVGYGPHPRECIEALRDADYPVIKGNHDHCIATGFIGPGMGQAARWAVEWTRAQLAEEELRWLEDLPNFLRQDDWLAVHGAPIDPSYIYGYVYRQTANSNLNYMVQKGIRLCFHGHSHIPGIYYRNGTDEDHFSDAAADMSGLSHSLVCPGSVGQSRSGVVGAEFAILDRTAQSVEFRRIDYDVKATIADMKRLGFPDALPSRLERGQ